MQTLMQRSHFMRETLLIQIQVWRALVLHDIKSRFFGNGLGYVVSIAWPLIHIIAILIVNTGRVMPYGTSMVLYAATAVIPYIACNYIGRFIILGVLVNKSFLQYPVIKPLDLMISRAFLEVVSNALVVVIIVIGMSAMSINVVPINVSQAVMAWLASIALGIGFGFLGGTITMAWPMFNIVYVLLIIAIWITCGIGINPESLPEPYGYYLSFNPVMHAVEWMKTAYYPDFQARLLSKVYLISFAFACFALGLIFERLMRSFLIQAR